MAAYPTLMLINSSAARREAGIVADRASNGRLRARRRYTTEKWEFDLTHWLTQAEKDLHEAHYQANKTGSFEFTWPDDGITRTCSYVSAPLPTTAQQPGHYVVSVKLMEV